MSTRAFAIFSDLDGTLLDHETYDWRPAAPCLARLRDAGIALVLASSKTAAEIAPLRAEMGFADCPAIVENGAGVLPPGAERPGEGRTHPRLRAALAALPPWFEGFSDWGAQEIARRTGLAPPAAARAALRDFSEPGLYTGPKARRAEYLQLLARAGITAAQGGRFLTLSFGGSKAGRMKELAARMPGPPRTIALGDAPNDAAMLRAADHGVIVPNPAHPGPGLTPDGHRIRLAPAPGPKGWAAAVQDLLAELTE